MHGRRTMRPTTGCLPLPTPQPSSTVQRQIQIHRGRCRPPRCWPCRCSPPRPRLLRPIEPRLAARLDATVAIPQPQSSPDSRPATKAELSEQLQPAHHRPPRRSSSRPDVDLASHDAAEAAVLDIRSSGPPPAAAGHHHRLLSCPSLRRLTPRGPDRPPAPPRAPTRPRRGPRRPPARPRAAAAEPNLRPLAVEGGGPAAARGNPVPRSPFAAGPGRVAAASPRPRLIGGRRAVVTFQAGAVRLV